MSLHRRKVTYFCHIFISSWVSGEWMDDNAIHSSQLLLLRQTGGKITEFHNPLLLTKNLPPPVQLFIQSFNASGYHWVWYLTLDDAMQALWSCMTAAARPRQYLCMTLLPIKSWPICARQKRHWCLLRWCTCSSNREVVTVEFSLLQHLLLMDSAQTRGTTHRRRWGSTYCTALSRKSL